MLDYIGQYSVVLMCQVLGVHRSGFYHWKNRPNSQREHRKEQMSELIKDTYEEFEAVYGAPRITQELNALGHQCSVNYVAKIMQQQGIVARNGKAFNYGGHALTKLNVADNVLRRDFSVDRANQKWVTDITYVWVKKEWLYLATVMDLYSRKIVGWSLDTSMTESLITQAIQMAIKARGIEPDLIVHSDRGTQYRSNEYVSFLEKNNITRSMSRKGNCWDNAMMESFFATLKKERIHQERYKTREEAISSIFDYIEQFYNRVRRHSALGYISPEEHELAA